MRHDRRQNSAAAASRHSKAGKVTSGAGAGGKGNEAAEVP